MNETLIILRGCSGSGKTTLAEWLQTMVKQATTCHIVSADDYHYDEEGNYNWLAENMQAAHSWCRGMVDDFMELGTEVIIVHNTSTTEKEIKPYMELADLYGYDVVSLVVENRHQSSDVHNVAPDILQRQYNNLRSNLRLLP